MSSWWNPLDWFAEALSLRLGGDLPSLRYFLTICLGYPISAIYCFSIKNKSPRAAHVYFIITGLLLLLWNYGIGTVHIFVGIVSTLAILHTFGPTDLSVGFTFISNMIYLLVGYYFMNYGTYDINWTMSYCILCLRLIGLAWDYRDGALPVEALTEYQKQACLKELPDLIEMISYCCMPTSCFAGPQFTWRHYQSFINQTLRPKIVLINRTSLDKYLLNPKTHRTLTRLATGLTCLTLYVSSLKYFPMEYMLTNEFLTKRSFFYRLFYMCVYTKFLVLRYLAIWLIGEGACVSLGLGCTGRFRVHYYGKADSGDQKKTDGAPADGTTNTATENVVVDSMLVTQRRKAVLSSSADGGFRLVDDFGGADSAEMAALEAAVEEGRAWVTEAQHTRCANVSVVRYESATNTDLLVSSFNINTNKWMLEYIYKRLRFLGNKNISQVLTLTFLAVWHGFYSGYYVNFFLEFITIFAEKQFLGIVHRSVYADWLYGTPGGKVLTTVVGKVHIFFVLSSPLVAFSLLRASLWVPVFNSVYWIGFIYLLWPLAAPLVRHLFPPKARLEEAAKKSE